MTQSINGRWTPEAGSKAFLDFGDDGALTGSDGANRIVTSWEAGGDGSATISQFLTTQMAAPGMKMWVGRARAAKVDGDTLIVFDHAGNRLGEMTRSSQEEQ